MSNENKIYDIIIIGAGPAGMTAAIYAGRSNKTVAIFDKDGFGGNIAKSPKVENIPGFSTISGADFATNMYNQMMNYSSIEHFIEDVKLVDYKYGLFKVFTESSIVVGKTVIFATGTKHRELDLKTKNIYYCVTCDGPFFKNKNVIVVGSSNTGATYALDLATYCKTVYLCDISSKMFCEKVLQDRIAKTENIHWLPKTTIKTLKQDKENNLSSVTLTNNEVFKVNAIFAAIGLIPQTDVVKNFAEKDSRGFIVSNDCKTTIVPGVFAAGDCRTSNIKQVTTACADGATAAIYAMQYLDTLK